ncbi:MAG TPA: CBS domain-containing protein [Halothiobacillaceae bacterium]|nr:CBS domain-containing protein [Halothiobacillaceae bacterium]
MASELWEIEEFIDQVLPFRSLPESERRALVNQMVVRYFRRGSDFPPPQSHGVWIVRSGALLLRDAQSGALADTLAEADVYNHNQVSASLLEAELAEDSLFYFLPPDVVDDLTERFESIALHFENAAHKRLSRAVTTMREHSRAMQGLLTANVSQLVRRQPVVASPDISIRQAAAQMTEANVSSLLLTEQQRLVGMITDRDLRRRCLVAGISAEKPVAEIMTRRLITTGPETPAFEAALIFSRENIHHLPIVDAQDHVLGLVSTSDLLRQYATHAVHLVRDAMAAESIEQIAQTGQKLADLQVQLVQMGADSEVLGEAVVTVTDALARRLWILAEHEFGPAPVRYAWVVMGSQARREQTPHTDQDNALILDDDFVPRLHQKWFLQATGFVADGLARAGLKHCPGEMMATNRQWQQTITQWQHQFNEWLTTPESKSLMLAGHFFDMRVVSGQAVLLDTIWKKVRPQVQKNEIFLHKLIDNALQHRLPLGFFRHKLVLDSESRAHGLDLKHAGLLPIVDIARIYALKAGLSELNTINRLQKAGETEWLSAKSAAELIDAWRLFYMLRNRHQSEQSLAHKPLDNQIPVSALSRLEQNHLRDAFRVVSDHQQWLRAQAEGRF